MSLLTKAGRRISNPEFEMLHPRAHNGPHAGEFVDIIGRLQALGAEWDAPKKLWMVPKARRAEVDQLFAEVGFKAIVVPEGFRAARDEDRKRLGLPPAWTDVFVTDEPGAKRLAIGRDAKGRQQAVYSAQHNAEQSAEKFARIRALNEKLPEIDAALAREAGHNPDAAVMLLVRKMGLRPGSNKDTRAAKQAFGASTLERRHVNVTGDLVQLDFTGKKGVHIQLELDDHELAQVLRRYMRGKNGNDRLFDTNEVKIRRWLENVAPGHHPKDFRTHLATATALALVRDMPAPQSMRDFKRQRNHVGDEVAKRLGNTRTMALGSYIDPTVFRDWENADTVSAADARAAVDRFATVEDRLAEVSRFGLEDWPEKGDVAKKVLGGAKDTQEKHTIELADGGRAYTPQRQAEHDRIIGESLAPALEEAIGDRNHPLMGHVETLRSGGRLSPDDIAELQDHIDFTRGGQKPRALFMAGGPASGKSTALRNAPELNPPASVTINPDDLKEKIPEYGRMIKGGEKYAATGVHEESSDLGKRLQIEAMDLGLNVVVDGTGDSKPGKFVGKIEQMANAGYDVDALYVTIPTDEAIVRSTLRAMHEGRWVPTPELRTQHENVSRNWHDVAAHPAIRSIKLFDNGGDQPRVLAEASHGNLTVKQERGYQAFIDKAGYSAVPDEPPAASQQSLHDRVKADLDQQRLPDRASYDRDEALARRADFAGRSELHREVADLVQNWTGGGDQGMREVEPEEYRQAIKAGELPELERAILEGPKAPTLYRGMRSFDDASERAIAEAKPGDPIELDGLSSFTEDKFVTNMFRQPGLMTNMLIELEGAQGLPVAAISNSNEAEWLLGGHVTITEVVSKKTSIDPEGEGFDVHDVHVKAKWSPRAEG